ncbi:protease B nonderepressible form [Gnomoniopsis smithogilvyi]|uniref:Protein PBN1 n=1 Tax=Gnomoniopsis smithogilvyi TaxID=1191159 RepID=A0A9W9CY34_9PEZI|nr:protease B nonderepressible form [Gnomoniopsis smithogilvyi]
MRQRITFLHKPQDGVDPAAIKVTDSSLTGPILPAVREDRITLALDELPGELRRFLQRCHELHIRWVSSYHYDTVSPLLSRLSPGLHLFYTPGSQTVPQDQLCATLEGVFGALDCKTAETSFTTLPNDRFSHSTAYQYYQPLESLSSLIAYAKEALCPASSSSDPKDSSCNARVDSLTTASTLDISYDTISHALKITASWPHADQPLSITIPSSTNAHRVEVGILTAADDFPNLEPHEIGMAGVLTVLGDDKKPSSTMFSFPARHRRIEGGAFSTSFAEPTGLHPALRLQMNAKAITPPPSATEGEECALHAYFTLPRGIFADKYQLADDLFLESKNLSALRYTSQPVDLEAPEYVMDLWGSAILLELSPPISAAQEPKWTAEVPLHLRYLAPSSGGYANVEVPYPAVFWACTTEEGTKFPASPFERVNLGYDGLFGPRTVFWHVDPQPGKAGGRLMSKVRVPVLDADRAGWVSAGTAVVVLLGFGWIVWKLLQVYIRTGYGPAKQMEGLEKKKQ